MAFSFSSGPAQILVVDDSLTVRMQLRRVLEDSGYIVVDADSGENGLTVAAAQAPDMLIIDVNMPGIDGLEMLRAFRELDGCAKTPAFVLTTESSPAMIQRGKEVGATAWIVKPFRPETLVAGLRKVLGR